MRSTDPLPEPDLSSLRTAFDTARIASGLTYDELAARTGLARRSLLDIAAGRNMGTLRTWILIARALDVSLDELTAGVWE
ncbi:helix-turn-helix domain-containing protein [Nostocoides australiense]